MSLTETQKKYLEYYPNPVSSIQEDTSLLTRPHEYELDDDLINNIEQATNFQIIVGMAFVGVLVLGIEFENPDNRDRFYSRLTIVAEAPGNLYGDGQKMITKGFQDLEKEISRSAFPFPPHFRS